MSGRALSAPGGRGPRRARTRAVLAAGLLVALLTPLSLVAAPTTAAAQGTTQGDAGTASTTTSSSTPTSSSTLSTGETTTTTAATTPTTAPSTATTTSDATAAPDETATTVSSGGVNGLAYAGAPWFRPGVPYTGNFPDPTVMWDTTTQKYWAFATSTGGSLMPAMSSTDLVTWTPRPAYSPNPYNGDPYFNDSFPVPPAWSMGGTSRTSKAQWAPSVVNIGGGAYRAYTSWEVAPGRRCISVARSSSVQGPYTDGEAGPLVCDSDPGGSIDPEVFTDTDGSRYLLWKSAGVPGSAPTKIKARKLSADGLSFAPGSSPVVLLQTELGWEGNSIENPSMVRYQGRYWLIYSGNEWESADYRMGQASCAGPLGPCSRTSAAPLIQNTASEWSPGGGSMFVDQAGRLRIIYQVWNAPYTSYPSNPNCDGPGLCASQGQRYYRIDGLAAGTRLSVDPVGAVDSVAIGKGTITLSGWALDPSSPASIFVHVYVDGVGTAITANGSRPDVGAAYPGLGNAHGFSATIPAAAGAHTLCVYGINTGAGGNVALSCTPVYVPSASPFGSVDVASGGAGAVRVAGWAIDPDTPDPIAVHVYVDGVGVAVTANGARPDVAAAYPQSGSNHGYSATVPAGPGFHTACAYGINVAGGTNTLLGCTTTFVPFGSPIGSLDAATGVSGGVTVGGWALDWDTGAPIPVHVYVDAVGTAITANGARPDIGAAFPAWGPNHGFATTVAAAPGAHTVCAYGINVGPGANSLIGCRVVVVPDTSPFGSLDVVAGVSGGVSVAGWAIDPDTTAAIPVHVYVDSVGTAITANGSRTDVGAVYPAFGSAHGYSTTLTAARGAHTVCAYAINVGAGTNRLLGCRSVTVP